MYRTCTVLTSTVTSTVFVTSNLLQVKNTKILVLKILVLKNIGVKNNPSLFRFGSQSLGIP